MSDELVIDLSNYKDRVGTRVIPGTYRVQVEDVELTESSNKNPMVNIWFTCLDGEFQGQTLTDRLVLTEKSMFRVVGFMQAIGLPTPKKKLKLNIRQFIGRVLDVEVDDGEPYNGRIRSEVRGYKKVPGATAGSDIEDTDVTPEAGPVPPIQSDGASTPGEALEQGMPGNVVGGDTADDSLDLDSVNL